MIVGRLSLVQLDFMLQLSTAFCTCHDYKQMRIYGNQLLCTVDASIDILLEDEDATVQVEAGDELDMVIDVQEGTDGYRWYRNPLQWEDAAQYIQNYVRPKVVSVQLLSIVGTTMA